MWLLISQHNSQLWIVIFLFFFQLFANLVAHKIEANFVAIRVVF